jgi:hypothetical protein
MSFKTSSGPRLDRVDISKKVSPTVQKKLIAQQFAVSMVSLVLGALATTAGVVLTMLGLTGTIQWSFSGFGINSKLANASPGIFLCVVGVLIIALNRFVVKIRG